MNGTKLRVFIILSINLSKLSPDSPDSEKSVTVRQLCARSSSLEEAIDDLLGKNTERPGNDGQ